jgi:hypothetical protein
MHLATFLAIEISKKELHVQDFQGHINDFVQSVIVITVNDFHKIEQAQQYLLAYLGFIKDPDCKPVLLLVLHMSAKTEPDVLEGIRFINCTKVAYFSEDLYL